VGRPDSERGGLEWDLEMSRQYKLLAKHKGFVHMYAQMEVSRKRLMESVVYGSEENTDQLRGAIWAFDAMLRLPDEMLENGQDAERVLGREGSTDE